jgi:hypothetical protein
MLLQPEADVKSAKASKINKTASILRSLQALVDAVTVL